MIAKRLTENSYLLTNSLNDICSLVLQRGKVYLNTSNLQVYDSLEDIAETYGENKITITEIQEPETFDKEIYEYPIKHGEYYEISETELNGNRAYQYKTREGSEVIFVAGWWIVPKGSYNRMVMSPKLTTINEESVGPYKTKFECTAHFTQMNRQLNE